MGAVLARCPFYLLMLYWLAGCASIGPTVVQNGRNTYNEAVASSGRQQTLINIVRVHRNETPVFLEIPEIDASSLLQVGATGAVTNLGSHAGTVGALWRGWPALRASPPSIRKPDHPLPARPGAGPVHPDSAPITVDTLSALFGSDWGLGPMFAYAFDQWVPGYTDNAAALNMMIWLDSCGAIGLAATRSDFSGEKEALQRVSANGASINIQTQPAAIGEMICSISTSIKAKRLFAGRCDQGLGLALETLRRHAAWRGWISMEPWPGRSASHRTQDDANKEHPGPRH